MKTITARSLIEKDKDLLTLLKGKAGYLPSQHIELAVLQGIVHSRVSLLESQIQPASLDLRLGRKAYRIQCSFLPENDTVEERLKDLMLYEVDLTGDGGILEKGAIYLVPLLEELELPPGISGLTNPKSSTGRLDIFTRIIADRCHRFDEIPEGYKGKIYLEVIPRSFPVRVCENLSLNQLRIISGHSPDLGKQGLEPCYRKNPILFDANGFAIPFDKVKIDMGLYVGVELAEKPIVAYKAKTNSSVIDLRKVNHYDPLDFWEPIAKPKNNRLILEPESFYIMMSKERIRIPPHLLAEMVAYEPNSGELRTHYAGFFDPGFGWHEGADLNEGTYAVMEVRPHDVPFMVEDGQTFCRLKFEKVLEVPEKVYGSNIHSHYQNQGLTLSKYFQNL
ncbi:MAG: 2'-deoxycytidine 5'-triphosphate deaminase [Nitrospinae bacterium CG11_big_fil_rev_8_21_14_0_20_56_8]|nr:MAG: 2'-deoxycytidine 5'-triphosphate deaminase [Nitrospinae bacterium CG11_big_fil_rev_8_21_14_0_20_56_8]